jgi:hypothetical protein
MGEGGDDFYDAKKRKVAGFTLYGRGGSFGKLTEVDLIDIPAW